MLGFPVRLFRLVRTRLAVTGFPRTTLRVLLIGVSVMVGWLAGGAVTVTTVRTLFETILPNFTFQS